MLLAGQKAAARLKGAGRYSDLNRFTSAHELAHMVLHSSFYQQFKIDSLSSYIELVSSLDEDVHKLIETQANEFAGLFLLPTVALKKHFRSLQQDAWPPRPQPWHVLASLEVSYKERQRGGRSNAYGKGRSYSPPQ